MGVQRSWFGDDEDEKKEPENSSGGGILDWAKEKASGAVDTVTQAGSDAYDWAKEKGGAAVDTVTQAGGKAYDWAKEKAGGAVDTVTEAGGDAYDWAKEKGGEAIDTVTHAGSDAYDWAKEKMNLLAQINGALQKVAGQEFVYLTTSQIATLNGYIATLSERSQGFINLPEVAAQTKPMDSAVPPGTLPVSASAIEAILQNLQLSVSSPFMSSGSAEPSTSGAESDQSTVQRTAVTAPPLIGAGVGGTVGGPPGAVIGFWIGVIVMIVMLIIAAILMASKYKEKEKTKEREKEKTKEKKCTQEYIDTRTAEYHELCDAGNKCSIPPDDCVSATAKVGRRMACVKLRTDFQQQCFKPGDPKYEGHMKEIAEQSAGLAECIGVMHYVCGDRKEKP